MISTKYVSIDLKICCVFEVFGSMFENAATFLHVRPKSKKLTKYATTRLNMLLNVIKSDHISQTCRQTWPHA